MLYRIYSTGNWKCFGIFHTLISHFRSFTKIFADASWVVDQKGSAKNSVQQCKVVDTAYDRAREHRRLIWLEMM